MWHAFSSAMLRCRQPCWDQQHRVRLVAARFLFVLVAISDIARYLFMVQSMQLLATQAARATIVPFGTPNYLGLAPGLRFCRFGRFAVRSAGLSGSCHDSTMHDADGQPEDQRQRCYVTLEAPFTAFTPGLSALTTAAATHWSK